MRRPSRGSALLELCQTGAGLGTSAVPTGVAVPGASLKRRGLGDVDDADNNVSAEGLPCKGGAYERLVLCS